MDVDIDELAATIRQREYLRWIAQIPIWSTCLFAQKQAEAASKPTTNANPPQPDFPPLHERRSKMQATIRVFFREVRLTCTFADNEEDKMIDMEHGGRLVFKDGTFEYRINGGANKLTRSFALRPEAPKSTFHIQSRRTTLYLLSTTPNPHTDKGYVSRPPPSLSVAELYEWKEYSIERNIQLDKAKADFGFHSIKSGRSKVEIEIRAAFLRSIHSVSSIYRFYTFLNHIIYWRRRTKLGRKWAGFVPPISHPRDLKISITADDLSMTGDLPLPDVHTNDMKLVEEGAKKYIKNNLILRLPKAKFELIKSQAETDMDLIIYLTGNSAALFGQPTSGSGSTVFKRFQIATLKIPHLRMFFPRLDKREATAKETGTRLNNTGRLIDINFFHANVNISNEYAVHEAVDGFILLQKGSKRIAKEMYKWCHPSVPDSLKSLKPGERGPGRVIFSALADTSTWLPHHIRQLVTDPPRMPAPIIEPEDVPKFTISGRTLSFEFEDDPFEVALSRIYQVGKREQIERLTRAKTLEKKAAKILKNANEEMQAKRSMSTTPPSRHQDMEGLGYSHTGNPLRSPGDLEDTGHNTGRFRSFRRSNNIKSASQSTTHVQDIHNTTEGLPYDSFSSMRTGASIQASISSVVPDAETGSGGCENRRPWSRRKHNTIGGMTPLAGAVGDQTPRSRHVNQNTISSHSRHSSSNPHRNTNSNSVADTDYAHYGPTSPGMSLRTRCDSTGTYRSAIQDAEDDVEEARYRLNEFESRNWIKKIRQYMLPPINPKKDKRPSASSTRTPSSTNASDNTNLKPPYPYSPSSWEYPTSHLSHCSMSPVRVVIESPLPLLDFCSIENYLHDMDSDSPKNIDWVTLIPLCFKLKCGSMVWQIRDYPFPFIYIPDPYAINYIDDPRERDMLPYHDFSGGLDISSTLIIAEPVPRSESVRNFTLPIGIRDPGPPPYSDSIIRWSVGKSLVFPRIYATFSMLLSSLPTQPLLANFRPDKRINIDPSVDPSIENTKVTPSILITWGACMQSSITAMSQRFESLSKPPADASSSTGWWDKLRARVHYRGRVAVVDARS